MSHGASSAVIISPHKDLEMGFLGKESSQHSLWIEVASLEVEKVYSL